MTRSGTFLQIATPSVRERPEGLPDSAASMPEAASRISLEIGIPAPRVRRALEKAIHSGELTKLAGGGRRGVSLWIDLDSARSWAKLHYREALMEQYEKRRQQLEARGHTIWRSRDYQKCFQLHAQAIEDSGGTKAARAGKLRDLLVASGVVVEASG